MAREYRAYKEKSSDNMDKLHLELNKTKSEHKALLDEHSNTRNRMQTRWQVFARRSWKGNMICQVAY